MSPTTRAMADSKQIQDEMADVSSQLKSYILETESRIVNSMDNNTAKLEEYMKQYMNSVVFEYIDNKLKYIIQLCEKNSAINTISTVSTITVTEPHSDDVTAARKNEATGNNTTGEDALPPITAKTTEEPSANHQESDQQPPGCLKDAKPTHNADSAPLRLRAANFERAKHDVYIGNLSQNTTADDVHGQLLDIGVVNIASITKLPCAKPIESSFRVLINDDSIKHNVYNRKNFESGIIVKPYRYHTESTQIHTIKAAPKPSANASSQKYHRTNISNNTEKSTKSTTHQHRAKPNTSPDVPTQYSNHRSPLIRTVIPRHPPNNPHHHTETTATTIPQYHSHGAAQVAVPQPHMQQYQPPHVHYPQTTQHSLQQNNPWQGQMLPAQHYQHPYQQGIQMTPYTAYHPYAATPQYH